MDMEDRKLSNGKEFSSPKPQGRRRSKRSKRSLEVSSPSTPSPPVGGRGRAKKTRPDFAGRVNSRAKGAIGERELAALLRSLGCGDAKRGQQRSGLEQADVVDAGLGVHFECKRVEQLNVWRAFEQAQRDAPAGTVPVVAMRRNRGPWLATLDLRVLVVLLRDRGAAAVLDAQALAELLG